MAKPIIDSFFSGLWYLFCGLCMGAADIVPGVSGGTIAFILGYYEELIENIKAFNFHTIGLFFRGRFQEFSEYISWKFLLILLSGILVAVATLSQVIVYLLNNELYRIYLYSAFMGLILASVFFIAKRVQKWSVSVVSSLLLGVLLAFFLTSFTPIAEKNNKETYSVIINQNYSFDVPVENYEALTSTLYGVSEEELRVLFAKQYITKDSQVTNSKGETFSVFEVTGESHYPWVYPWIIFCGMVGVSAMLLPGVSGSYLLTILGAYAVVIGAIADLTLGLREYTIESDALILLTNLFLGIIIGAALFSRLVSWLLHRYYNLTIALLVGFMVGAMRSVWPFWEVQYRLNPLRMNKGVQLMPLYPTLPDFSDQVVWVALGVAICSFIVVFAMELLVLKRKI